jgi:hypothetical protein
MDQDLTFLHLPLSARQILLKDFPDWSLDDISKAVGGVYDKYEELKERPDEGNLRVLRALVGALIQHAKDGTLSDILLTTKEFWEVASGS